MLGDVSGDAIRADGFPFPVTQRQLGRQYPRIGTIRPGFLFLFNQRFPGTNNLLFIIIRHLGMFNGKIIKIRLAHSLRRILQTQYFGLRPGYAYKAAFQILEIQFIGNDIQQGFY